MASNNTAFDGFGDRILRSYLKVIAKRFIRDVVIDWIWDEGN